jgi:hypothetical protein
MVKKDPMKKQTDHYEGKEVAIAFSIIPVWNWSKKHGIHWIIFGAIISLLMVYGATLFQPIYKKYKKPPELKIVEVEKIVHVQPETVPTSDLITFLNPKVDPNFAGLIGIEIDIYAKKHNLPRTLIVAIMRRESNFNPLAASKVAVGLMQLYPKWHPEKVEGISRDQLFHTAINIDICSEIWAEYFETNDGDIDKTIHAYLSKDASITEKNGYKNDILTYIALLNIFEFRQLNKPGIVSLDGPDDKPKDLFKHKKELREF